MLLAKETYEASGDEKKEAQEKIGTLPLHHQMLMAAYHSCKDIELANYKGGYAEDNAETLKKLYSCLTLYGFSFAEEESVSLMDGTHAVYAVREEPKPEETTAENEEQLEADAADYEEASGEEEADVLEDLAV